jgi:uncharacterized protein
MVGGPGTETAAGWPRAAGSPASTLPTGGGTGLAVTSRVRAGTRQVAVVDSLDGAHGVGEPLLHDLLGTRAVARLRGLRQAGAAHLLRSRRDVSRYEHAVGVMLLVRRLGGGVEEQAAALIHDVPCTAFAHAAGHAVDDAGDRRRLCAELVDRSDLPAVLERHSALLRPLLERDRWPLLAQPLPDLSADLVDDTLRALLRMGWISLPEVRAFLDALAAHEGRIVVTDPGAAVWFSRQFHRAVTGLDMDPLEVLADVTLGLAIRLALRRGIIHVSDLLFEDDQLLRCMMPAHDHALRDLLADLGLLGCGSGDIHRRRALRTLPEARCVDPLVLVAPGRTARCSHLEPAVERLHAEVRRRSRDGVTVHVLTAGMTASAHDGRGGAGEPSSQAGGTATP